MEDQLISSARRVIEDFCKQNLDLVRHHPRTAISQFNTERESTKDYEGRVIFEFFQNAIDRADENVVIQLLDERLIIANDGIPFSIFPEHPHKKRSDFHALCTIHDSEKIAGESVGNKGVGFKSVWNISREVLIESVDREGQNWGFRLYNPLSADDFLDQPEICEEIEKVKGLIPSFYFPKFCPVAPGDLKVKLTDGSEIDVKTKITIFLTDDTALTSLENQIDKLRKTNLCFLGLLKSRAGRDLNVVTEYKGQALWNDNHKDWKLVSLRSAENARKYASLFQELDVETANYRKRYDNLPEFPDVAVAFPPTGRDDFEEVFYTYLPTNVKFGFNVLCHADFALDNSRTAIPPNAYNIKLLKIAVTLMIDTLCDNESLHGYPDFYRFLKGSGDQVELENKSNLNHLVWQYWKNGDRLRELLKKVYRLDREWQEDAYQSLFQVIQHPIKKTDGENQKVFQDRVKETQLLFCDRDIAIVPVAGSSLTFLPDGGNDNESLFYRTDSTDLPLELLSGVKGLKISSFSGLKSETLKESRIVREFGTLQLLGVIEKIQFREPNETIREDLFAFAFDQAVRKDHVNFSFYFDAKNAREERSFSDILVPVTNGGWKAAGRVVLPELAAVGLDMHYFKILDLDRCMQILAKRLVAFDPERFLPTIKKMGAWTDMLPLKWDRPGGGAYSFSLPWEDTPKDNGEFLKVLVKNAVPFIDTLANDRNGIFQQLRKSEWFLVENLNKFVSPSQVFLFNQGDNRKLTCIPKETKKGDWAEFYRVMAMQSIEETSSIEKLIGRIRHLAVAANFNLEASHAEIYRALALRLSRINDGKLPRDIPVLIKKSSGFHYRDKEDVWFAGREYKKYKHLYPSFIFAWFDDDTRNDYIEHLGVHIFKPDFRIVYTEASRTEDLELKKTLEKDHLPVMLVLADDVAGTEFKKEDVLERWQRLKIYKDSNVKMMVDIGGKEDLVASTEFPNMDVLYRSLSSGERDNLHRVGELAHDLFSPKATQNRSFPKFGPAIADGIFRNTGFNETFTIYLTNAVADLHNGNTEMVDRFLQEKGIAVHDVEAAKAMIQARLLTPEEWQYFLNYLSEKSGSAAITKDNWMNGVHYEVRGLHFSSLLDDPGMNPKYRSLVEQLNPATANRIAVDKGRKRIQAMYYLAHGSKDMMSDEGFRLILNKKLPAYDLFLFDLSAYFPDFEIRDFDESVITETMFDLEYGLTNVKPLTGNVELVISDIGTLPNVAPVIGSVDPEKEEKKRKEQHERGIALEEKLSRIEAKNLPLALRKPVTQAIKTIAGADQQFRSSAKFEEYMQRLDQVLGLDEPAEKDMWPVFHVSKNIGDGLGYDILVPRLEEGQIVILKVEVKSAVVGSGRIFITENERLRMLDFIGDPDWRLWLNGELPLSFTEQIKKHVLEHNEQLSQLKQEKKLFLAADQWIIKFKAS